MSVPDGICSATIARFKLSAEGYFKVLDLGIIACFDLNAGSVDRGGTRGSHAEHVHSVSLML